MFFETTNANTGNKLIFREVSEVPGGSCVLAKGIGESTNSRGGVGIRIGERLPADIIATQVREFDGR